MPEQLAQFIREYIAPPAPVAKQTVSRYHAWVPTKDNQEPPF